MDKLLTTRKANGGQNADSHIYIYINVRQVGSYILREHPGTLTIQGPKPSTDK